MSESSKRNRTPDQKFEAWAEGDKHAPLAIRQRKRREQAKGREKREKLKQRNMGQTEEGNVEMNQKLVEESLLQENLGSGKDNLAKEVVGSRAGEGSNSQPSKKKLKKQNKNNSK